MKKSIIKETGKTDDRFFFLGKKILKRHSGELKFSLKLLDKKIQSGNLIFFPLQNLQN
jgi:hypothetical protein